MVCYARLLGGSYFLHHPSDFFFPLSFSMFAPPPVWLATGFLRLLQNDNRLLIYSELISPLIRGLVNLRAGNSRGVDLKDRMTERKRKRRSARSQGVSRKGCWTWRRMRDEWGGGYICILNRKALFLGDIWYMWKNKFKKLLFFLDRIKCEVKELDEDWSTSVVKRQSFLQIRQKNNTILDQDVILKNSKLKNLSLWPFCSI